jgi:hypothetical protein
MTEREAKDRIVHQPVDAYKEYRERIGKAGQMASFPEFKPVIDFLIAELDSEYVKNIVANNPVLLYELKEVRTFLFHINLKFQTEEGIIYPYAIPFDEPFPYRPTIDAIEAAIRFFDKVNRVDPTNKAVKLYHFDRYCYHRHSLVANPDIILFPTTQELTLTDFIKTRSVPIEFIGVVSRTTRVDGHWQSPLDFWYHDLNHARRLYAYIKNRLNELGYFKDEEIYAYIEGVDRFLHEVVLPEFIDLPESLGEEDKEIRKMATMIIFEIIHETALTLEREAIIDDLLRPNGPQPFEVMSEEGVQNVESLRTPTGNLKSGASFADLKEYDPTTVNYFFDKTSIGLLANVFSKLNHNYYDEADMINENIVAVPFRTPEFIAKAAKYILQVLRYEDIPADEELLSLVTDREGLKERILHTPLIKHEAFAAQEATDPMKADEIIQLIKGLNKKVYTLFGYSALGYEDEAKLKETVRRDLEPLSRDEYVINIGATEEGIGKMYEVAKEMGFKTIGVVSTQALSYSGRFSESVDSIYIVNDDYWGGYVPGTDKLAETTKAYLGVSDFISAYGGGINTVVTLKFAKELGIPTKFEEFDMNHALADKAFKEKLSDYSGAASASLRNSS